MKKLLFAVLVILMLAAGCIRIVSVPSSNDLPIAYIDAISPTAVPAGGTVYFDGHGTDVDGDVVAYSWRSSIDGNLSTTASFNTSSLSAGVHTIYLTVQDNDGGWSEEVASSITVSSEAGPTASAPIINSFAASPGSITSGGSSTLTWNVFGARRVSIDHGIGNVTPAGTRTVSPGTTTTYTLTATNAAGTVIARARVTVSAPPPPPPSVNPPVISFFTANPASITPGNSSMLSWLVSDADTVTISYGSSVTPVGSVGSAPATPPTTTTYTLTATNAAGTDTDTVQVVVGGGAPPGLPVISYFTASPGSITLGASSTLSWSVSGAATVSVNQGVGAVPPSASILVSPAATTTYTLTATNASGSVTQPVQVVVSGGGGGGDPFEQALFDEVNSRRANPSTCGAPGTPPMATLTRNASLDQLARDHSAYMAAAGKLSHDGFPGPGGRGQMAMSAVGASMVAENVLWAPQSWSASQMVDGWCNSPGHQTNMLNPAYTRTGMGIFISGGYVYATQIFTD